MEKKQGTLLDELSALLNKPDPEDPAGRSRGEVLKEKATETAVGLLHATRLSGSGKQQPDWWIRRNAVLNLARLTKRAERTQAIAMFCKEAGLQPSDVRLSKKELLKRYDRKTDSGSRRKSERA